MQCISCKKQNKSLTRVSGQWVHYTASLLGSAVIFTESVGTPKSAAVSTNKILLWIVNPAVKSIPELKYFSAYQYTLFCICGLCGCWGQHCKCWSTQVNRGRNKILPFPVFRPQESQCSQYLVPGERFLSTDGNSEIRNLLSFLFTDPVAEKI